MYFSFLKIYTVQRNRGTVLGSLRAHGVRQGTVDTIYAVIADGIFTGPGRAAKKTLKGMCPFCIKLDHKEVPESTRHLAWDCPYSRIVWEGVIRAAHLHTCSDHKLIDRTLNSDQEELLSAHGLACIFGYVEGGWRGEGLEGGHRGIAWRILMHETLVGLVNRRNWAFDGHATFFPFPNPDTIYSRARKTLITCAFDLLKEANDAETTLSHRYGEELQLKEEDI